VSLPRCPECDEQIDREQYNDLIYKIAAMAKELADEKMEDLRFRCGTDDTRAARRQECLGMTKGDLIEAIIVERFVEELI
jgi:hypothetical protein